MSSRRVEPSATVTMYRAAMRVLMERPVADLMSTRDDYVLFPPGVVGSRRVRRPVERPAQASQCPVSPPMITDGSGYVTIRPGCFSETFRHVLKPVVVGHMT